MASVSTGQDGLRRILFVAPDGSRKTIYMGRMPIREAESVCRHAESLLASRLSGQPVARETAVWVSEIGDRLRDRLVRVGLLSAEPNKPSATLGSFLTSYLDGRADLKPATKIVRGVVVRDLVGFFGDSRDVGTITHGDCDDFRQSLVARGLAPSTIHKRLQVARSFFHAMQRRKLLAENPFDGVNSKATGIRDRQRFVTREETKLVLDACPDHNWRTIVALSRFGGLRCPSEVLSLRLNDIYWHRDRILVTSPKTEHHPGKESRLIPLFAELRPFLEQAFELAPEGAIYVIDERFRKAAMGRGVWLNTNLRTTFQKIVRRAGLKPWPRLFHNLRASRETELVEKFSIQAVTDWLGNTPRVAMKHYLMTTDEHFDAAVRGDEKATQNPTQHLHEQTRTTSQPSPPRTKKPRFCRGLRYLAT